MRAVLCIRRTSVSLDPWQSVRVTLTHGCSISPICLVTDSICLVFSAWPNITLLRHALEANMARAFLQRTMVPIYCSCNKKINSLRSARSISGDQFRRLRVSDGRLLLTLFVECRLLADRHGDQPDLFSLPIGCILIDCYTESVRAKDV